MGKVTRWIGFGKRITAVLLTVVLLLAVVPYADSVSSAEAPDYDLPWLWPVPGSYKLNSLDYYYGGGLHNQGQCIDIGANGFTGSNRLDVVSATDGRVHYIQSKYDETTNKGSGWGNYVVVETGNFKIVYAHLKTITCDYGEIKAGDVIGKMGNTGTSTGVHLHLQAYPTKEGYTSTSIRVFDQYFTNPLYYEKFQFMKGLKTYSILYGDRIAKYYTNTSGSYYTYSGGLDYDFDIVPASAAVKVVNSSGASLRSLPVKDNAYNVDTYTKDSIVKIQGGYTDAYGDLWLLVSNTDEGKTWLHSEDVGFYEYRSSVTLKNAVLPQGSYNAFHELPFSGVLESQNRMISLTLRLLSDGITVASAVKTIDATAYDLSGLLQSSGVLNQLEDGTYTLELSVAETALYPGADASTLETVIAVSEFSINDTVTDEIAPFIEAISVVYVSSELVTIRVTASDNVAMDKVSVTFTSSLSGGAKTFLAEKTDSGYLLEVDASELDGAGEFTVEAVASDAYGNTSSATRIVEIPEGGLFESWIVVNGPLSVRADHTTESKRIKNLSVGDVIAVTEIFVGEKYVWGKSADGWSALDFCQYQNGNLYEIRFDLNGGEGDLPLTLPKSFGAGVTLPEAVPTKKGCTFLGWAVSSDAATPDYVAGDVYTADESVTLFAVWSDTVSPVIWDVTVTPEGWTNGAVTVKVNASDNSDSLFYSFDGGKSWRKDGNLILTQNRLIAARNIAVKDGFGNVTYYDNAVSVDRIDTLPPNVMDAKIDLAVGEGGVVFTCDGVNDAQSGIARYELLFSKTGDFSDTVEVIVTDGQKVTLEEGLYYAKMKAFDVAGNSVTVSLDRFLVGDEYQLGTPTDLQMVKTSTAGTELKWSAVTDADSYVLSLSLDKNFTNPIEITVDKPGTTVTGLANAKYYARVMAKSAIGSVKPSEWSTSISFHTRSEDNTIHAFPGIVGMAVDHGAGTATWTSPYNASSLNLTVTADPTAAVTYWTDKECRTSVDAETVSAYPFVVDTLVLYIRVEAENGEARVYTLTVTRDAVDILPNGDVDITVDDTYLYVGEISITADRIIEGLEIKDGISILDADGNRLNGTDTLVGTGATIVLEGRSGVLRSLVIILRGDLDGDGVVTVSDATTIHKLSNGMLISKSELDLPAGDMNGDGKLSAADAYLAHIRA